MKLRVTIVLLAALATLLCAADTPQPNTESQRDARKLRYSQRQKLENKGAGKAQESDVADPTQPLSLLPAGTELALPETEKPNQAPEAGELTGGVTATGSLDSGLDDAPVNNAAVRSLAIDGAPYGEPRKVVQKESPSTQQSKPQQLASNTGSLPTLRGPQRQEGKSSAATNSAPPLVAKVEPARDAKKPTVQPAAEKVVASSKPAGPVAAPKKTVPILVKPEPKLATSLPTELPDQRRVVPEEAIDPDRVFEDEDGFKVLDGFLASNNGASDISTDQLRQSTVEGTVAADAPLIAENGEPLETGAHISETELGSLSVPGQPQPQQRGSLGKWLLGIAGVLACGVLVMAVPKRRTKRKAEDGLTLIEKIGLEGGLELVILRKKHYAFVLGVTRQATHLLEKVSMSSLDSDYHSVINAIIKRECEATELWRMRPLFSASYRAEQAPEERAAPARRTSLSELRSSLQVVGPAMAASTSAQPASMSGLRERSVSVPRGSRVQNSGDREAVIRRLREQARRAS